MRRHNDQKSFLSFTVMKINFSRSYHNFWQVLFHGLILLLEYIISYGLLSLMDFLVMFFCTNQDIYIVNINILFM